MKLIWSGPAEAGFDRNWEIGGFCGILIAFYGEGWGFNHGGATACLVDVFVWATEVEIDAGETK